MRRAAAVKAAEERLSDRTFWFVDAAWLRTAPDDTRPEVALSWFRRVLQPASQPGDRGDRVAWRLHQKLLTLGKLSKRTLRVAELLQGLHAPELAAVSHRWESRDEPDPQGSQLAEIIRFAKACPRLQGIWYDAWSLPQGELTSSEQQTFDLTLPHINLIYLGLTVLAIFDNTFQGRFWTLYELWLSLQKPSPTGLKPAPAERRRVTAVGVLNLEGAEGESIAETLTSQWAQKSPEEALRALDRSDICVTNLKDKSIQLGKVHRAASARM